MSMIATESEIFDRIHFGGGPGGVNQGWFILKIVSVILNTTPTRPGLSVN